MQILFGFLIALGISLTAYRTGSLSLGGCLAATGLGAVVFGLGGVGWAALLIVFFVSSSILSRLFGQRKQRLGEKFSKGSRRDAAQVLANGGVAGLLVLFRLWLPESEWLWVGFAGSMAAVNADTWATELGTLSRSAPRLITSGETVAPGTSGGITLFGTLASLSGAFLIAVLFGLFKASGAGFSSPGTAMAAVGVICAAGLGGSMFDSLLGATLQAMYRCPACAQDTERHPAHSCGSPTSLVRGWRWLNNDYVNAGCALVGALAAIGLSYWLL